MLFVTVVLLATGAYLWLRRWLNEPVPRRLPIPTDEAPPRGEAAKLLEEHGYEVIAGKYRLPISIKVDGKHYQSRYFIDMFASKGEDMYMVKLARDRLPMEWTGSGIRDRLLPYYMLFDEIEGIVYVDVKSRTVTTITFEFE